MYIKSLFTMLKHYSSFFHEEQSNILKDRNSTLDKPKKLPSLNKQPQNLRNKNSSKTLHAGSVLMDPSFFGSIDKSQTPQNQVYHKKRIDRNATLKIIHVREGGVMSPKKVFNVETIQTIDFNSAIYKIQELFNEECLALNWKKQKIQLSKGKTGKSKFRESRLLEFQTFFQPQPIKLAKRQFEQILRVYDRYQIPNPQPTQKIQVQYSIFKKSSVLNSSMLFGDRPLTYEQKSTLMRQSQAFQRAQKHYGFKSFTTRLLFHHLTAELALELSDLPKALWNLYFCEYYGRKVQLSQYIIPCLVLQAQIKQSLYEYEESIKILKTALEFSLVKKYQDLQFRVLEKISIAYYYRGNSYMSKYYKQLSQKGLSNKQRELYLKEYSKQDQLKQLEAKLFSFQCEINKKKKHNQIFQMDISRSKLQAHQSMIVGLNQKVNQMLKDNETTQFGIKVRKMIIENNQKSTVYKFNSKRNSVEQVKRYVNYDYPIENCSQVLKSHLSKDRIGMTTQLRNVSFLKTMNFCKHLHSRLSYQCMNSNHIEQNLISHKENIPRRINQSKIKRKTVFV